MKIFTWSFLFSVLFAVQSFGQNITIEGTVKEKATGDLLPGVNVIVEGTSIGSVTDIDGNYTIDVPTENSVLQFSFIGMAEQSIIVGNKTTINVEMLEDSELLENVIVVAYGTTTKEAYTGAAEVVGSDVIEARPVTSFEKSLQGTTAGLQVTNTSGQPGSSATVRIRGVGSLSASSSPLYVIDGVPMSGALSDINPNDIESLTVLKDAAASSLYGSRAANGVIIITTKQGKKGSTKISFNAQTGISSRISSGYELMNSSNFYEQSWSGLYNQYITDGKTIEEARAHANSNVEDIVGFNPFGVENPLDENGKVIPGTKVLTNTNWRDEVYKTGIVSNYNLSVSGGNEATQIFFSLGYFSDSGTTLSSDFKRYSAKVNVTHKVNKFITAGMNNSISYSITNAPPGGSGGANPVRSAEIINAATPVYNADGTYNWDNTAVFDFNPIGLAEMDEYKYKGTRALVNAFINIKFLPELNFRTTGAIDYSGNEGLNYYNPYHGNGAGVNGRSSMSSSNNMAWNISNILSWNKTIGSGNFEVLAGQEAHGERFSSLSAGVTDFSIPGKPDLSWGASPETPGSGTSEWNMISFLGQAKYNYAGKYYLSASLRSDGSSRFGEDNKYGLFYSFGSSWRITEEEFMPELDWLNNLKLRASYGTSGNNNIGNYASLSLYGSGYNYGGSPGLSPIQLENSSLAWEKITSFNVGLESRFFNRLNASFEYYVRASDGLLLHKKLSAGKGFSSILTNLGAMTNSGLEATLDFDVVNNTDFRYNIGLNLTTNKNVINELAIEKDRTGTKLREKGGDLYQFFMREWAGVDPENGKPMWFTNIESDDIEDNTDQPSSAFKDPNGSGRYVTSKYSDSERVRAGTAMPDFYGGFSNDLTYKNFDLNFYFYFSYGGQIYNSDYAQNMHDGTKPGENLSVDAYKAWSPNNRYTDVPRYITNNLDGGNQMSTRFLEDASYLRLKNISLGYNLSPQMLNKIHVKNLRVYVSAENILTFTKYRGFDPEASLSGTTNSSIPGVKVVTFGLKLDL